MTSIESNEFLSSNPLESLINSIYGIRLFFSQRTRAPLAPAPLRPLRHPRRFVTRAAAPVPLSQHRSRRSVAAWRGGRGKFSLLTASFEMEVSKWNRPAVGPKTLLCLENVAETWGGGMRWVRFGHFGEEGRAHQWKGNTGASLEKQHETIDVFKSPPLKTFFKVFDLYHES